MVTITTLFKSQNLTAEHKCPLVGDTEVNTYYTVNSLISRHPRELKKASFSRTVCLREFFPKAVNYVLLGSKKKQISQRQMEISQNRSPLFCCSAKEKYAFVHLLKISLPRANYYTWGVRLRERMNKRKIQFSFQK